jgi:hypothetical protein
LEETRLLLRKSKEALVTPSASFWADAYRRARLETPPPVRGNSLQVAGGRRLGLLALSASVAVVLVLTTFVSGPVGTNSQETAASQTLDQVDVSSLISAHADYLAGKRLADGSNNRIIRSDLAAQTTGDPTLAPADVMFVESAPNGTSD